LDKILEALSSVGKRLDTLESKVGGTSSSSSPAPAGGGGAAAPFVEAFDALLAEFMPPVISAAQSIKNAGLIKQTSLLSDAFAEQRRMVLVASTCKKPSDADLQKILAPTAAKMGDIEKCKDNRSEVKEHLNTVAEGAAALSWVLMVAGPGQQAPVPFITETVGAAQMWGNKILSKYRSEPGDDAKNHVAFVKGFIALLQGLAAYAKANHATGLSWKASGGDALAAFSSAPGNSAPAASSAPPASGPPPPGPPPPGPPPGFWKDDKAAAPPAAKTGDLFAALSKGEGVTSGLKKVDDSMKTHKNPELRASGAVPEKAPAVAAKAAVTKAPAVVKPPRFELQDKKWVVENQVDNMALEIEEGTIKQTVYLQNCSGKANRTVLQVKSKVNSIMIDGCSKTSLVVHSVLASIEAVNSKNLEIQVNGPCPTMTLDNVNGCQIYLSAENQNVQIFTSKCSAVNVVLPGQGDNDPKEEAIPEQYVSVIKGGKLTTEPVAHVGA